VKPRYHREITIQALQRHIYPSALKNVITANLGQDAVQFQFGHDHFHYDNNSFQAGDAYCQGLRQGVRAALARSDYRLARQLLGRLTHTVQDFYAHSNYVSLWREQNPDTPPDRIEIELEEITGSDRLCSGKIYFPLELFSFIPILKPVVLPLLPRDSHAWMNLDDPSSADFAYAFAAAVRRTEMEFLRICDQLPASEIILLIGSEKDNMR
jgi:hypothetical protein